MEEEIKDEIKDKKDEEEKIEEPKKIENFKQMLEVQDAITNKIIKNVPAGEHVIDGNEKVPEKPSADAAMVDEAKAQVDESKQKGKFAKPPKSFKDAYEASDLAADEKKKDIVVRQ